MLEFGSMQTIAVWNGFDASRQVHDPALSLIFVWFI
jgi:hypothetical protein